MAENNFENIKKKRIIIDTDIALGQIGRDVDDGLAILMALNSEKIDVLALTEVYGNTTLKNVKKYMNNLISNWKKDHPSKLIPKIIEGADKPIRQLLNDKKSKIPESEILIDWVKNNLDKNKVRKILNGKKYPAVKFFAEIIERISNSSASNPSDTDSNIINSNIIQKTDLILVPIGPLTNIALFFILFPEYASKISALYIMGGKLDGWEFNFANDPIAVNIVFQAANLYNIPVYVAGLEVCTAQMVNEIHLEKIFQKNTYISQYLKKPLNSWLKLNKISHSWKKGSGFYPFDPCALINLIYPNTIEFEEVFVQETIPRFHFRLNQSIKTIKKKSSNVNENKTLFSKVNWGKKIDSDKLLSTLISLI